MRPNPRNSSPRPTSIRARLASSGLDGQLPSQVPGGQFGAVAKEHVALGSNETVLDRTG
jgi:hypothetical protein